MSTSDYIGVGTLITALGAAVVSIIVALRQTGTKATVEAIHDEIQTPNGGTIGEVIGANDLTGQVPVITPDMTP